MQYDPHSLLKRIEKNVRLVRQLTLNIHASPEPISENIKNDIAHLCQVVTTYNKMFKEIFKEYDIERQLEEKGEYEGPPELH